MAFKNPADKLAWRRAYKLRFPEKHAKWEATAKRKNDAINKPKRVARLEAVAQTRNIRQNARDIASVPAAINEIRLRIMERDGLCKCYRCQEIKPKNEMAKVNKGPGTSGTCKKCSSVCSAVWRKQHPDIAKAAGRKCYYKSMANPVKKLRIRLADRAFKSLKGYAIGTRSSGGMDKYLGCSIEQAKQYIERQFKGCMSWDNLGKAWHIDHVFPLSRFDLTIEEQRRRAFHYTNLQPLWVRTNIKKSDHVPSQHQPLLIL